MYTVLGCCHCQKYILLLAELKHKSVPLEMTEL